MLLERTFGIVKAGFNGLDDIVSCCQRPLRGEGHSVAGRGTGGSDITADCRVQSLFIRATGCRYLRCTT